MKKFLDFTSSRLAIKGYKDPSFIPFAPQDRYDDKVKKIIDKLKFGFKCQKNPYIYFLHSHDEALMYMFWHLILQEASETGKNQLLFEAVSGKTILEFAKALKGFSMISTLVSPTKEGVVSLEFLDSKLGPKSLCFSHRLTHPILGTTSQDYLKIGQLLKDKGVYYHVDITKTLGEQFFDLETIEADFITFDISSINIELQGGVIFSKKPLEEFFYPAIKPDIIFLESFIQSLEELHEQASTHMLKKITLKMHLMNGLKQKTILSPSFFPESLESLSYKLLTFKNVHSDALNFFLQSKKACVELGGGLELPLHLLLEMCFVPHDIAVSTCGICVHETMTQEDIDSFVAILDQCYQALVKGAL